MTTPTTAAQANDLGERCSLIIGDFGYVAKALDRHSIWMADQPWLKITPQSSANPGAVYISSSQSLTMRDYDRFSRVVLADWRGGGGQITFTPDSSGDRNRYFDSSGADIHDEGRLRLVHSMSSKYTTTSAGPNPLLPAQNYLYFGDASAVKFSTAWGGAPSSAATSAAGAVNDLASDGLYIYAAVQGVGIDRFTIGSTTAGTAWAASPNTAQRLLVANRRLYAVAGAQLFEIALASATTTTDFTTPSSGYTLMDLCALTGGSIDAPIVVMGNTNSGSGNSPGRSTMTWYWDGATIHDFVQFPVGFVGQRMKQYLGVVYLYGFEVQPDTTVSPIAYAIVNGSAVKLGYLGTPQANGNPTVAAVVADNSWGLDATGTFVYFSVNAGTAQEVWRYDIVNGGLSRYISFATGATEQAADIAIYQNGPWVSLSGSGGGALYGTNSTFVTTGTLTQSDLNLGQPWASNLWATLDATFAPLAAGEQFAFAYSIDGGANFVTTDAAGNAMTKATVGATSATFIVSNSTSSRITPYIRPRTTLTAGTSQLTTPSLYSLAVKAIPANPPGVILDAWLACADTSQQPNGQLDWQGASAAERFYNVVNLYQSQTIVNVIYMAPGPTRAKNPTTISAVIDDYEIDYYSPTGFKPGGGPNIGVEGDLHVILRQVTTT